jgi:hypothetical protein
MFRVSIMPWATLPDFARKDKGAEALRVPKHFRPDSPVFDLPQHAASPARVYIVAPRGIAVGANVQPS